jgi:acyl-CoA synthetase (NDP forming)
MDLTPLLRPRRVAVIGASANPHGLGGRLLIYLRRHPFAGEVLAINPSRAEIDGHPCYPSLTAVPGEVDHALIIVRADLVPQAVADCVAKGVKAATVFSSGFAEERGADGARRQADLVAQARAGGLRLVGPNAEGFYSAPDHLAATFSPTVDFEPGALPMAAGGLAIVSQSGGVGFSIFARARARRQGVEAVFSTGNEADLGTVDIATALLERREVKVVAMFLEAVRDGGRFVAMARRAATLGKPIIAAKVGRTDAGARAAASHTASLAGRAAAFDAVAKIYGVITADDADDLVDIAGAFTGNPLPAGNRVAVLTTSGGSGVWMTDTLAAAGLQVPPLSSELRGKLEAMLPSFAAAGNPVDVTAQAARGEALFDALRLLGADPDIDMIVLAGPFGSPTFVQNSAEKLATLKRRMKKPLLLYSYSPVPEPNLEALAQAGLYCHARLTGTGKAARALADYAAFKRAPLPVVASDLPAPPPLPRRQVVPEYEAAELLAGLGLPLLPGRLAKDANAAAAAAESLGFPVALKLQSPDLPHKSDIGGVALNVKDAHAVKVAAARLADVGATAALGADIHGLWVQPMARPGVEMIVGVQTDASFGPMVLVGVGGLFVEAAPDVALAPAPLDKPTAERLIRGLRGAPALTGGRGRPPADIEALAALLVKLSHLAVGWRDRLESLDLNPVLVHPAGQGLSIVDALIVTTGETDA